MPRKDGRAYIKNNKCIDCGKRLSNNYALRCKKCNGIYNNSMKGKKGKLSLKYKHGGKSKCIDCNTVITYGYSRCKSCAVKYLWGQGEYRNKNRRDGKYNSMFGKKQTDKTKEKIREKALGRVWKKESIVKLKQTMLNKWKNKEYKNKVIRKWMESLAILPNKPERILIGILNKTLPNEYKYVGDGQVIIGGYIPDFINCNGKKKIIEHFGCYWHKCKLCKFGDRKLKPHDIGRLRTYKKYGYKTLIIWGHELKNIKKITKKIGDFSG